MDMPVVATTHVIESLRFFSRRHSAARALTSSRLSTLSCMERDETFFEVTYDEHPAA